MSINVAWISIILTVIQLLGTVLIFCIVKFNDLHHISLDLRDIKNKQDEHDKKISKIAEEVAYLKGIREGQNL